ncbi:type II toxin-antitoxin system HicB family antitoxin [bacterium]|nr:type II toxin-antitoxin system HicB family antitoxin [bacterium]
MNYPIVIHKDEDSDYGVTVPDLPGCFSAGRTVDEAIDMAREAIELHLEGLIEDGALAPSPSSIEDCRAKPEFKDGIWAVVSIAPSHLRLKAKRVNITMPERVLDAVDRYAETEDETRSGLLVKAALAYMDPPPKRSSRRIAATKGSKRHSRTR